MRRSVVFTRASSSRTARGLQPRRLELVALVPPRKRGRVGDAATEPEGDPGVLDGAGKVPRLPDLVRRLVVVVLLVELFLLAAEARRLSDDVSAFLQVRGGHAYFCEIELVGAVKRAAVWKLVTLDAPALHFRDGLDVGVERRLALADQDDVLRPAKPADAVHVDVHGDAPGGNGRVLREVFRAEKALFFPRDEGEVRGARGRPFEVRVGARDGENRRHARGVVEGAVVDRVGARLGAHANPEVVMVRGVDHGLSCALRIRARPDADDVAGLLLADFA